MLLRRVVLAVVSAAALFASHARAENLKVVAWNLESGEAKPSYLSTLIADFQGVDLWGFSEVVAGDAPIYAAACAVGESGQQFEHFVGTTGGSDRLVIVYNATKLELVSKHELLDLKVQTGRAPLYGVFKSKQTGDQFIFMVNHLHRTKAAKRMEQAVGLEKWSKNQPLPAIVVGDFNFDVNVSSKQGNAAFVAMTDEHVFRWVEPAPFRATHKGGSVLDFVFLSGPGKTWTAKAEVFKLLDDAVDTLNSSDHRPLLAQVNTTAGPVARSAVHPALFEPNAAAEEAVAEAEFRQKKRNEVLKKLRWNETWPCCGGWSKSWETSSFDFGYRSGRADAQGGPATRSRKPSQRHNGGTPFARRGPIHPPRTALSPNRGIRFLTLPLAPR